MILIDSIFVVIGLSGGHMGRDVIRTYQLVLVDLLGVIFLVWVFGARVFFRIFGVLARGLARWWLSLGDGQAEFGASCPANCTHR